MAAAAAAAAAAERFARIGAFHTKCANRFAPIGPLSSTIVHDDPITTRKSSSSVFFSCYEFEEHQFLHASLSHYPGLHFFVGHIKQETLATCSAPGKGWEHVQSQAQPTTPRMPAQFVGLLPEFWRNPMLNNVVAGCLFKRFGMKGPFNGLFSLPYSESCVSHPTFDRISATRPSSLPPLMDVQRSPN